MNQNNPFDNVQFGAVNNNTNFQQFNNQQPYNNQNYQQNNEYQNNRYNNQYDVEKDKILYELPECVYTGKNNQNQFTIRIRSYNNTQPKIELVRVFTNNTGNQSVKNIRLSLQEWELLCKYGQQLNQTLGQLINQQNQQVPF